MGFELNQLARIGEVADTREDVARHLERLAHDIRISARQPIFTHVTIFFSDGTVNAQDLNTPGTDVFRVAGVMLANANRILGMAKTEEITTLT